MNSRERVLTALSHNEPDRVSVDFGATMETTIHLRAYRALKDRLDLCGGSPVVEMLKTAGFARPDEEVQRRLHADVRGVFPNRHYTLDGQRLTDEFGIGWQRPSDGGLYYDICSHPMAVMTLDEIEEYPRPAPRDLRLFESTEGMLSVICGNEFPVVFDNCFGNGIFQTCNQLMGYDVFLMAMALTEPKADYLMDRILELKREFGNDPTFWGGGIDTQKLLPTGTVQEVKEEVKRMLDVFMPGGGYVFAPVHAIQDLASIIPTGSARPQRPQENGGEEDDRNSALFVHRHSLVRTDRGQIHIVSRRGVRNQ